MCKKTPSQAVDIDVRAREKRMENFLLVNKVINGLFGAVVLSLHIPCLW